MGKKIRINVTVDLEAWLELKRRKKNISMICSNAMVGAVGFYKQEDAIKVEEIESK